MSLVCDESHARLVATAEAAAQALAGRSRDFELGRTLPQDVAETLAAAGLYRLLTPADCGGHEAAPATFFEVVERLARADAAAAWCCFISCTSSVLAAYLPQAEAQSLFGQPTLKAAGVFAPRGLAVPATLNGVAGVRVSGRWAWGSGTANADLVSAGCLLMAPGGQPQCLADGTPRVLSVVLPRSAVRLLDNWDSMGLQGTGSGEFMVDDAFVPLGHTASLLDGPRLATPLYRFPVFGLLALGIAAVACGIAREAMDVFVQQAAATVPQAGTRPLAARATVQQAVAQAEAQLASARAWLAACIAAAWQAAQAASADPGAAAGLPVAHRRDIRLACTHAVHSAAEVVTRVYTLAGGGAIFHASPLQRALRNVHVATQHMMVGEATWELTGRLLLNQPTQVAML
jgi:indole-3-acetate monooxygenase